MPKITALPAASAATGAELSAVVQGGVTKKLALSAYPISTATQTEIDSVETTLTAAVVAAQADIDGHEANTSNPHSVTKAQVGLGNVDNTSDATKNSAVATLTNKTIALPSNTLTNQKTETGTVSAPLITQLNNTLFAHDFGAVGDDSTDDYTALQAFLNAIASSGKEGRFDAGKKYYVSGSDLTITNGAGNSGFRLIGYGAQLRTNPAQTRTALRITRPTYTPARYEEARITLIEGLSFNAFQDGNGIYGIDATGVINMVIRNCTFTSGADGGTAPSVNYAAIRMRQTTITDPDTGCFWTEIEGCRFKGGATGMPNAIWLEGAVNAMSITKNNFANVDTGVRLLAADRTGTDTANAATIPNGVKVLDNSFEGILDGIKFNGNTTTANKSRSVGLQVQNNRIESVSLSGTAFFNYNGLNLDSEAPPIVGPNYVSSGDTTRYISNSNALTIDVRDEYVGRATIDPASLAANATTTIGTITLAPSLVGDQVKIEVNGDLQGLIATGYVSSSNTVTIRLTNPTSGAINLGSTKFIARVRPQY